MSGLTAALRYEWIRLRTIRSTWWISTLTVLLGVSISFLIGLGISQEFGSEFPPGDSERLLLAQLVVAQGSGFGPPLVLPYLMAIIGVFAWGHEYRHGMIRATLTTLSSRVAAWIAKYVVAAAWIALVILACLALCTVAGWFWLRDDGIAFATYDVWRTIVKCAVYSVVFAWIAMALTSLLRNQTAALVLAFVWPLALEAVIQQIFEIVPALREHVELTRFLPFDAGNAMLAATDVTGSMWGDPLTPWAGFIVFAGFAAVLMALSAGTFLKRDA